MFFPDFFLPYSYVAFHGSGNLSPLQQTSGQRQREKGRNSNINEAQNNAYGHGRGGGNNSFNDFGKSMVNHDNSNSLKPLNSIGNNSGSSNSYQQEQYQSSIPNIKNVCSIIFDNFRDLELSTTFLGKFIW